MAERFVVPPEAGVTPGEGRGLSSRQTQDAVRDQEIGQPINSGQRSETADGVAHAKAKAEPGYRFYALYDKDQPRGHSGACLCPVPLQQGRAGRGPSGLPESRRGVMGSSGWLGELALALRQETYRPDAIRRVFIPKANGKLRAAGHLQPCGIGSA